MTEHGSDPEGLDTTRVGAWLADRVPEVVLPLTATLIAGGRSNLTFEVRDAGGHRYALRRPPLHHVLPTAHDMTREHRLISALWGTPVPVPRPLALCTDEAVNGSPFFVMAFVDGLVLRTAEATQAALDEACRRRAGESLIDTLAALHAIDVDAVGLGGLAKRDGYVQRQLRRWTEQFRTSQVPGLDSAGRIEAVRERLAASIPEQLESTIVHGDYRLDNTVLGPDGSVRAVLDWEICTLGDPRADLGTLLVYWAEPGDDRASLGITPTALPGFPTRAELVARYAAQTGRDVSAVDWFTAFGYWKLACIAQGVHHRYMGGAAAGDRSNAEGFADAVLRLAQLAADVLDRR